MTDRTTRVQTQPTRKGGDAKNLPSVQTDPFEAAEDWIFIATNPDDAGMLARCTDPGPGLKVEVFHRTKRFDRSITGHKLIVVTAGEGPRRQEAIEAATRCRANAAKVIVWEVSELGSQETPDLTTYHERYGLAKILNFDRPWEIRILPGESSSANGNGCHNGTADHRIFVDAERGLVILPNGKIDYSALALPELGLLRLSDIEERPIQWLWPYRLARGEMALIAGEGGVGKSQLLLWVATAVSRGWPWPDQAGDAPIGDVVILSAEDDPSTTIKPRLRALGADLDRIWFLTAKVRTKQPGKETLVDLKSLQDVPYFRAVFDSLPNALLFIVDPVVSYLGDDVDDQKNAEVRKILEPFIEEIIRPRAISFFANTHLNKSVEVKNAVHRVTGSIAYVNLARNLHIVLRDPDNKEQRFFAQAKCNNAPDDLPWIAYKIERRSHGSDNGEIETSIPVFSPELVRGRDLGQVVAGERGQRGPKSIVTAELTHFLHGQLEEGSTRLKDLVDRARDRGLLPKPTEKTPKPSISKLYDAKDMIPQLFPGWQIADFEQGEPPRKYWELVPIPEDSPPLKAAPF